jgi:hypothetical protein
VFSRWVGGFSRLSGAVCRLIMEYCSDWKCDGDLFGGPDVSCSSDDLLDSDSCSKVFCFCYFSLARTYWERRMKKTYSDPKIIEVYIDC